MMLSKARCSNVEAVNADFLITNPVDKKYSKVTHMFVSEVHIPAMALTLVQFARPIM